MAEACGCENEVECKAQDTVQVVKDAPAGDKMTVIVSKCESGNIKVPVIAKDPVVIRDRFIKTVAAQNA